MDGCFLPSNSFPKTTQVLPSARLRLPTYTSKSSTIIKYQTRKSSAQFSISCCQSGPAPASPSPRDAARPLLTPDSDWRAFRAKLVASERALPSQVRLSLPSLINPADGAPQTGMGDLWAHPIHELEKGCLLIASEKLDGVDIYERTIILLLSTGPIGPTGLILNRPSKMSIREMRSSALDVSSAFSDRPLFSGGPMEDEYFLVSPDEKGKEKIERSGAFGEVMKGLYHGTAESVRGAAEMVKSGAIRVTDFRFFDGYCAWEGTQLREEIRAGYWTLAACSPAVIGLTWDGNVGLWEKINGLVSPNKVL